MSRSSLPSGRRPMRAALALTIATALALSPAPAVAREAPAPAAGAVHWADLAQREVVIAGARVPVPAALAGVAAAAAVLGGLTVVLLQAVADALPGHSSTSSSLLAGSSGAEKPQTAPGEHITSFNFSAVNGDAAIGGLSGIDEVAPGRYIVLSDDKGEHGPIRAYYFTTEDHKTFTPAGEVRFTDPQGNAYTEFMDPEEIRILPSGNFLWTTEGNAKAGQVAAPQIIESTPEGKEVRRIDVPAYHAPDGASTRGIHHNNGPEGMALLADGNTAVTVNEDALAQDGVRNSEKNASMNRLTFYDLATGKPTREYVVRVEAGRGATSLLADENGDLYLLERGFFPELGDNGENKAEIYKLDLAGAGNVLGVEKLDGPEKPAAKSLVFDFAAVRPHPDNVEGLAWGPRADDGRRTLVVVSDDNFNDTQTTYFHTLLVP